MNYGALSAFMEFSVSLAILLTRRASVVAETSQHSTETIPNLALFHEAIFTAVSTRPCTEATVTAGCRKPLCQELHNIAVMEEMGLDLCLNMHDLRNSTKNPSSYLHLCISVTA